MNDEIAELLEAAMFKEVASAALYRKSAGMTDDPAAATLLRELAGTEEKHLDSLKNLPLEAFIDSLETKSRLADLLVSAHLKAPDELAGADLTDTVLFAIKREAESVSFYSDLMGVFSTETAKSLCRFLAHQEMGHKLRLELLYDNIVHIDD
ncbi:ferritin family protein [Dehalogenimonas sp. THU2]|uniref:ferritin family protein n=1 Tax=Dehalogenimonas sp. THU2 TaxID=3151121 RepID=UPI00321890A4